MSPSDIPASDDPCAGPPVASITLSCTQDLVALVPYLMGYVPDERVVVVVVDDGRLGLTLSLELAEFDDPERARHMVCPAVDRFADPDLLLCVWSADASRADEALACLADWFPDRCVLDAVTVGPAHWWSWFEPSRGGSREALATAPAVAQAVVAGLTAEPSRQVIEDHLDGPGRDLALSRAHRCADTRWSRLGRGRWTTSALELQHSCLGSAWADADLTDLAVLAMDSDVVDALWLSLDEHLAPGALDLWLAVVHQAPEGWEAGALAMASFCGWLSGNGVVHVAGLERLVMLRPDDDAVVALDALNRHAVPPGQWARVRAREVFGVPL